MAKAPSASGALDKHAPHGLGCRGEEVAAIVPASGRIAGQAQPGFVHERRRLEREARGVMRQARGGQFAQLLIDQGQQLGGGLRVALLDAFKN
jgi:hypothetical protein